MRLFEIESFPTEVAITNAFAETYATFLRVYPILPKKALAFCRRKLAGHPGSKKDYPFSKDGPLKGYEHDHLIKGDCMVIYRGTHGNLLKLYVLVDHSEYEGGKDATLAEKLKTISKPALHKIDPEKFFAGHNTETSAPEMTDAEKKTVLSAIYELVADNEFIILRHALRNNIWDEFLEWINLYLPDLSRESLFSSFAGGEEGVKGLILDAISQLGKTDEFNKI